MVGLALCLARRARVPLQQRVAAVPKGLLAPKAQLAVQRHFQRPAPVAEWAALAVLGPPVRLGLRVVLRWLRARWLRR